MITRDQAREIAAAAHAPHKTSPFAYHENWPHAWILDAIVQAYELGAKREWRPIETAPRDGTVVLVANEHGCWPAKYVAVYQSGYRPENPWQSMMLNHEHMRKNSVLQFAPPTHWQPLPPPPDVSNEDLDEAEYDRQREIESEHYGPSRGAPEPRHG